jgi:hypothetical protein
MGQRLIRLLTLLMAMTVAVRAADQRKLSNPVKFVLEYFEKHDGLSIDEFLDRMRPAPIDLSRRAGVIAAMPPGAIPPDAQSLAKMSLGDEVLAYHRRRGLIAFTIVKVAPAFIGLHGRSLILVSANILPLLTKEEFAALVAHEVGHEYVWAEYRDAEERHDHARIRELELRCDGIAVLTLRRLGIDVQRLVRALQVVTWYNRELGVDGNAIDYVSPGERRAFIDAMATLQWVDLTREPANDRGESDRPGRRQ